MKFLPFFTIVALGVSIETAVAMTEDDEKRSLVLSVKQKDSDQFSHEKTPLVYNAYIPNRTCIVKSDSITLPRGRYKLQIGGKNKSYSLTYSMWEMDKKESPLFEGIIQKDVPFDISASFNTSKDKTDVYFTISTRDHNEYEIDLTGNYWNHHNDEFTLTKCEIIENPSTTCLVN